MKVGDSIRIEEGDRVSAWVPRHFVYAEAEGDFSLTVGIVEVAGALKYLAGDYLVVDIKPPLHETWRVLVCENSKRGVDVVWKPLSNVSVGEWLDVL